MKYKYSDTNSFISIMQALISFCVRQSLGAVFKSPVLVLSVWCWLIQTRAENCFTRIKWDQRRLYWYGLKFYQYFAEISSCIIVGGHNETVSQVHYKSRAGHINIFMCSLEDNDCILNTTAIEQHVVVFFLDSEYNQHFHLQVHHFLRNGQPTGH